MRARTPFVGDVCPIDIKEHTWVLLLVRMVGRAAWAGLAGEETNRLFEGELPTSVIASPHCNAARKWGWVPTLIDYACRFVAGVQIGPKLCPPSIDGVRLADGQPCVVLVNDPLCVASPELVEGGECSSGRRIWDKGRRGR